VSDPVTDRVEHFNDAHRLAYLLRAVAINAYAAYMNGLAHPGPAYQAQSRRTRDPQPGDLVLETSTLWRAARYVEDTPGQFPNLGVLLRMTTEPMPGDSEDEEPPTERVWYVRPLDGSVPEYRWTNADFIRVLTSLDDIHPTEKAGGADAPR
jgi:hypothetical protein